MNKFIKKEIIFGEDIKSLEQIKDNSIVTLRNGEICTKLTFDCATLKGSGNHYAYNNNLTHAIWNSDDIIKVENNGKIVFERKEVECLNPEYWKPGKLVKYNEKKYVIVNINDEEIFIRLDELCSTMLREHINAIKNCNIDIIKEEKIDYKAAFEELSEEYKKLCTGLRDTYVDEAFEGTKINILINKYIPNNILAKHSK